MIKKIDQKKVLSEWISIQEELPNIAGFYLTCADWAGVVEKTEFDGRSRWNTLMGVTHWMALPEPPECI